MGGGATAINAGFAVGGVATFGGGVAFVGGGVATFGVSDFGGGSGGSFAISASSSATMLSTKFVSDLLALVAADGYDGIDLDWEDAIDWPSFIALAHDLRTASPTITLTAPGGAVSLGDSIDANIVQLAGYLDRYNLMTYGAWLMAGVGSGWCSWHASPLTGAYGMANAAGCSAPRDIASSLDAYVKAGIPSGKLGMGVAFSAMCYNGPPYVTAPGQVTDGDNFGGGDNTYPLSLFFAHGSTFDNASAAEKKIDSSAQVPYLSLAANTNDANCGGMTRYISYDDETSLIAKGAFSKAHHYGGIIVWTLDQGLLPANASGGRAPNALTQALKTGFLQ